MGDAISLSVQISESWIIVVDASNTASKICAKARVVFFSSKVQGLKRNRPVSGFRGDFGAYSIMTR